LAERYDARLTIADAAREELKSRCTRHENGARMLDASIDGELLPPLSLAVLQRLATGEPFAEATLDWNGTRFEAALA
jgi:type VI secretion system protein VasG